jgi:hypothetical protein
MKKLLKIIILFIFSLLFSSCAPFTRNEQTAHPDFSQLDSTEQVGQSFLARYDGLQGISVFIKPGQVDSGELTLNLYTGRIAAELIRSSSLPISDITTSGFYNMAFLPIKDSTGKDYFFNLAIKGAGSVKIGSATGNSYLSGAQYISGLAQNSQTSFRLDYLPSLALFGLIKDLLNWFLLIISGLVLFAIPGWAALLWLFPPWNSINWISKLGLAIGTGLVFYPILFLWTNTFGLQLGAINAFLLPITGLVFIFLRFMRVSPQQSITLRGLISRFGRGIGKDINPLKNNILWITLLPDLVFLLVVALIVFTRFWPIRTLDAPMWGDSYQHTMISQLMVDNGGLFTSWEPYAQLKSFTYHFGFHSLVASLHWLTKLTVMQSTLWLGQLLNIFVILAIFPLAQFIGKSKWAGVIAILIAGLISPMPMFYVNWGRYTQLAGQVVLPAVIVIIWLNLDSKPLNFKWISLIWFGLAGLILTHYRVMIFIPLFYLSYFLLRVREAGAITLIKRSMLHLVGAVILIIPWVFRIFEGTLPDIFGAQITTSTAKASQALNNIGNITEYLPIIIWILAIISILWGIWQGNQKSNIFSLWWFLILFAANPQWFQLPGSGILTNFAIFLAAYIPASVIIGTGGASLLKILQILPSEQESIKPTIKSKTQDRKYILWSVLVSLSLILISIWFVRPRIRDVKPLDHALLTRPDVRAADWIDQNLPPDAKFLVNSFFAYGGTLTVGSDGGWWLPLITGRETSQPPLTYGSEEGITPDFVEYTNSLISLIEEKGLNHPDVLTELQARGFTHIYIGQQQGLVNASSPPFLDPRGLQSDPNFELIYNEDRVQIYEIVDFEG